jgi:drug/metabolite transporter (DMT)-like permease
MDFKGEMNMIMLAYGLVCLIFGTTFLAIKIGVDAGTAPFFAAGLRFFIAGILLFLWMVWKGKADFKLLLRKEMLLTGATLTFGTFAALYWGEQYVSSGLAAVLSATGPMMILLIQTFILREKASSVSLFGCILGLTGVLLLVLPNLALKVSSLWFIGCIVILIGEISYSVGAVLSKKVSNGLAEVSPIALNAAQMMYGGLFLLMLSLSTEKLDLATQFSLPFSLSLLYLTVIGSMVGHSLFYWLVAKTDPVFPSTWLYVAPPIAVGVGVLFYNETVNGLTLIGIIIILAGTMLVNAAALKGFLLKLRKNNKLQTKPIKRSIVKKVD